MEFETLLAKSFDESSRKIPAFALLHTHLRFVQSAGETIFEMIGEKVLDQIGLNSEIWLSRLKRGLSAACLYHDIGKANDGFQKMIQGKPKLSPKLQPIRHELLSALLLAEEGEVRTWAVNNLSEYGKLDDAEELLECVIAAVGGHHRKLGEKWTEKNHTASIALRDGGCGSKVKIFLLHENLKPLFRNEVSKDLEIDLAEEVLEKERRLFRKGSNRFADALETRDDWRRFAAVLKALTSAADVAGSALPEKGETPQKWIRENLAERQFLKAQQMREVVKARLDGNDLRKFQKAVADSEAKVTLVEAGCGTGKTVAAYAWAENHADGKKLFFCYPTTGTATEGYRGYVAENDVEAELIHSRSSVDIEDMTEVKGDEETKEDEETEKRLRIESLKMWYPQVIVCTADTVLSLVRNNRRGWYNSPSILSASFVFDELHAYDNRMFAAVVALIKALPNAHFLLMTASLPKDRKDFLLKNIKGVKEIPNPKELEELPRYQFQKLSNRSKAFEIAERARNENLKILWICNTVARTQKVFDDLMELNLPAQTYHSRFKYEDRKERHRQVIDGFDKDTAMIAVTTQVAEMSLDLDADILISEAAPVPALIQRLGRLNRRINSDNRGTPRTAYFLPLEKDEFLPYKQAEIENAMKWIDELIGLNRPLCQVDLAEYFHKLSIEDKGELNLFTNWLDSGWFAVPESVRDPNVSVSVILAEDVKACLQNGKEITNKAIPMTFNSRKMDGWKELKSNLIAPPNTIEYCKMRGAKWLQK